MHKTRPSPRSAKAPREILEGGTEWLTARQVAELVGMSERSVRRAQESGRLRGRRTDGGHLRFLKGDVEAYLRGDQASGEPSRGSSVLRSRREALEGLNLEIQELQARKQFDRLRDEQAERAVTRSQEREQQQRAEAEARAQAQRDRESIARRQQEEKVLREWHETWREFGLSLLPADAPVALRARVFPEVKRSLENFVPDDAPDFVEAAVTATIEALLAPHREAQASSRRRGFLDEQKKLAWGELQNQYPATPPPDLCEALNTAIETRMQGFNSTSPWTDLRASRAVAIEHVMAPYHQARRSEERKHRTESMIQSVISRMPRLLGDLKRNRILRLDSNETALLVELLLPKARKFLELKVQERDLTEAEISQLLEDFVLRDQRLF
jgi:excisionase family DNA binding protein